MHVHFGRSCVVSSKKIDIDTKDYILPKRQFQIFDQKVKPIGLVVIDDHVALEGSEEFKIRPTSSLAVNEFIQSLTVSITDINGKYSSCCMPFLLPSLPPTRFLPVPLNCHAAFSCLGTVQRERVQRCRGQVTSNSHRGKGGSHCAKFGGLSYTSHVHAIS